LAAIRQKAEGRGQKGRKKEEREKGIISDYPFLDIRLGSIASELII